MKKKKKPLPPPKLSITTEKGVKSIDLNISRKEWPEKPLMQKLQAPIRRRMPDTRESITHKFNIAGHKGYLNVGLFEDGTPGEIFITMNKEGSTIGGLMDTIATLTSIALQYGVPLESLVKKFSFQRFEPSGLTTNREIPNATSLSDYVFRWLGHKFIPAYAKELPNPEGQVLPG